MPGAAAHDMPGDRPLPQHVSESCVHYLQPVGRFAAPRDCIHACPWCHAQAPILMACTSSSREHPFHASPLPSVPAMGCARGGPCPRPHVHLLRAAFWRALGRAAPPLAHRSGPRSPAEHAEGAAAARSRAAWGSRAAAGRHWAVADACSDVRLWFLGLLVACPLCICAVRVCVSTSLCCMLPSYPAVPISCRCCCYVSCTPQA